MMIIQSIVSLVCLTLYYQGLKLCMSAFNQHQYPIHFIMLMVVGEERWILAQSQTPHHIWSQINNKFTPKSIKTIRHHI